MKATEKINNDLGNKSFNHTNRIERIKKEFGLYHGQGKKKRRKKKK